MNRRFLFLLALLATALGCVAQTFTLRGRVTDGEGNPVEFASVACPAKVAPLLPRCKASMS